jgi:hypothetical protein
MTTDHPPLPNSAETRHKATLLVLQEVLEYMERLPKVPTTTEWCLKIQQHLDAPGNVMDIAMLDTWQGHRVAPSGHTYATATLRAGKLEVKSPQEVPIELQKSLGQAQYERRLLNSLFKGLKFDMKNIGASLDSE